MNLHYPDGKIAWNGSRAYHQSGAVAWQDDRAYYDTHAIAFAESKGYHANGAIAWDAGKAYDENGTLLSIKKITLTCGPSVIASISTHHFALRVLSHIVIEKTLAE